MSEDPTITRTLNKDTSSSSSKENEKVIDAVTASIDLVDKPSDSIVESVLKEGADTNNDTEKQTSIEEKQSLKIQSAAPPLTETYWLTRILFIRFLGFLYAVAFLVAWNQNESLIGENGLTPAINYVNIVRQQLPKLTDMEMILQRPTLFWVFTPSTDNLNMFALLGLTISIIIILLGSANVIMFFGLWALYFSIVEVGQRWYSFGWESQLLEVGFLAMLMVPIASLKKFPKDTPTPWFVVWGYRWLLFRIMLGAGLIKIRGDQCWLDLTCMNYHYLTQPVPNPLSTYFHQNSENVHKIETMGNHVIELFLPIFLLSPWRWARFIFGGAFQIFFQVVLVMSGNLSFLNWLTALPAIMCFDDRSVAWMFSASQVKEAIDVQRLYDERYSDFTAFTKQLSVSADHWSVLFRRLISLAGTILILYLSYPVMKNMLSPQQHMNISFEPFRIVNTYGAFGSITKVRNEVILQGTTDTELNEHTKWVDFEFRCKPGDINRVPCIISPYHLRIDWLMWFAAFQNYQQCPWLVHLVYKLLQGDATTDALLAPEGGNPFAVKKQVPTFVRAELYEYRYVNVWTSEEASEEEGWEVGRYWKRKYVRSYLPALDKHNPSVQQFLTAHGMLR